MDARELIESWLYSADASMALHYDAARHFERRHYLIGVPALVLSTAVGTTVFAALQKDVYVAIQFTTGAASVLAAILTGLQTFLGYNQRAAKHQSAGAAYAALIREIHQEQAFPLSEVNQLRGFVEKVRTRFDALSKESPSIPERLWKLAASRD
ncbi:MAG TPA: SLATT domain-containing protein [Rudaea sp.]|jgi:DNA-binding PucR family transcriptional regulator